MANRVLPHSQEAEESLLGCYIVNQGTFNSDNNLEVEDFYYPKNQEIFKAIEKLYTQGDAIDLTTVSNMLEKTNTLAKVGGIEYLIDLTHKATTFNVKEYATILKELSKTRALINVSNEITDSAYDHHEDVDQLITDAEAKIYSLAHSENDRKNLQPIEKVVLQSLVNIKETVKNRGKITGIPSGFVDLDRITNGFQKSDLIILAARPSMGKTAFALNVAANAAIYESKKVLIFSLEMSSEQLGRRLILSESHVEGEDIASGNLSNEKWKAIISSSIRISGGSLFISDSPNLTVPDITSICRKKMLDEGIDLIIIDYMQLMHAPGRFDNRQTEISEISRSLKQLAREMNCPVICLSQLARGPEARSDKRPLLSDLRDSGSIEQDADIVMFLFRENYYDKSKSPYVAELNIAKHRNGPTETIKLGWIGSFAKFSNYSEEEQEEAS